MKKTLRVGLIGFGMIGKVHAYCISALPYYAPGLGVAPRVVAVATSRDETAARAKETLGCDRATVDYREIVEDPNIDVVEICPPNAEHFPALLAAIDANKHIYCEKPVVASAEEARALREALEKRGPDGAPLYRGTTGVAFHTRGFTAIRRAKELIDSGKLGQIVQYRVGYYHSSMLSPTTPYRWKHGESGGTILDLCSHLFDAIDYLVGLPAEVLAQKTILSPRRPTRALKPGERLEEVETREVVAEDSVVLLTRGLDAQAARKTIPALDSDAIWEYPGNAPASEGRIPIAVADPSDGAAITGVVEATKLVSGAEDEARLEINGTRGSIKFDLMKPHRLEFYDGTRPAGVNGGERGFLRIDCGGRYGEPECEFPSPKSTTGWLRAHVASTAAFYRAIETGESTSADLAQGLRIQDALEAVRESAKTRAWKSL